MTVIQLNSGKLLLHSPIKINEEIKAKLNQLGKVTYIVAPNKFHHLHIDDYLKTYPEAKLYLAPGLEQKRADLNFHKIINNEESYEWSSEVDHVLVEGIPFLNEVVLYNKESKTAIFTDLVSYVSKNSQFSTKLFGRIENVYEKLGVMRIIRKFFIKDKEKVKKSFDKILEWDIENILFSHVQIIEDFDQGTFKKLLLKTV